MKEVYKRWTRSIVLRWIFIVIFLSIINSFAWYERNEEKNRTKLNFSLFIYLRHIELSIGFGISGNSNMLHAADVLQNEKIYYAHCSLHFKIFIWHFRILQIISLMTGREISHTSHIELLLVYRWRLKTLLRTSVWIDEKTPDTNWF